MIAASTAENLDRAAELLRAGELVAFPTETVYGLGANAWNASAVRKIFAAKGRPPTNPLIVHVASRDQLQLAMAPPDERLSRRLDQLAACWPGPLTVVVPRHARVPDEVTAGLPTVGVRVPDHPVALELLRRCDFPVAAPSANPSNYVSPTRAEHVDAELGERVALILDGGACRAGVESTIVTLVEEEPRVLRVGALPVETLAERLDCSVETLLRSGPEARRAAVAESPESPESQLSPGRLPEHYAPRTPLRFADELDAEGQWYAEWTARRENASPPRIGWIAFRTVTSVPSQVAQLVTLSERGDLEEVARGLFAALRQLDQTGLDLIVVERCDETGWGRAIMDRLRRARRAS